MTDRRIRDYVYARPARRVDVRPTSPNAPGREGDYHADDNFFYLHVQGQWRRAPWDIRYGTPFGPVDGAGTPLPGTAAPGGTTASPGDGQEPGWPDIDDQNLPQHDHSDVENGGSSLKPSSLKIAAGTKEYADSTNGWLYASYK